MSFSLWSRTRRVLFCVGLTSAVIAAGIVTATVTTRGQVLALPGPTESTVVTVEPTRVLDTRVPVGLNSKLVAATPQNLQITGSIDTWTEATQTKTSQQVVPTGATGVLMNVTAVSPTASGYLSVRPGNATGVPATAGLNFDPGDIIPNAINIALPTTGEINLYYGAANTGATMDVVIDIVGYTTNTGLIDLVNRVTALENSGVAGPQGEPGTNGVDAESPARVIWVADDGTGDFLKLSTALVSITDATATKPYVIKIAPGVYTETANVAMKNYVDVEGSGQNTTTINCACSSSSNNFDVSAAVISAGAITAEIRHLTINNTGGSNNMSVGVYTNGYSTDGVVTINNVTATAIVTVGGETTSLGVYNKSSSPTMTNVTATATGGTFNRGVSNQSLSSPSMNNVTATATGGANNYGVINISSSPTIRNSSITGTTNSIFNDSSTAQVAVSMLDGLRDGGGIFCVGVYDESFAQIIC